MADKGAAFKHRIIIVGKSESQIWSAERPRELKDLPIFYVL